MGSAPTFQRTEGLLATELSDSEVVMLDVERGEYFGCEGVSKTIWDALEQPLTLDELVAQVKSDYPDAPAEVAADVKSFVTELHENALVMCSTDS